MVRRRHPMERMPAPRTVERAIETLLEGNWWPATIAQGEGYFRVQDDCDGDLSQNLVVFFGQDGDAWIKTNGHRTLRFRNYAGGGMSLRVRNALLLLAEAVRRDNEERPQLPSKEAENGAR